MLVGIAHTLSVSGSLTRSTRSSFGNTTALYSRLSFPGLRISASATIVTTLNQSPANVLTPQKTISSKLGREALTYKSCTQKQETKSLEQRKACASKFSIVEKPYFDDVVLVTGAFLPLAYRIKVKTPTWTSLHDENSL
jgi:hypothetical protein